MNLSEKSMATLELPAVLDMLAAEAVSEPGKAEALELRPLVNIDQIRIRQQETSAAKAMIAMRGNPSFYGVRDVGASLQRADMGGMLNTRELLHIAGVLRAARTVKAYAGGDRDEPTKIDYLFRALQANKFLEEKITTSIVGEDELADSASPELYDIRRKIRVASARIQESLRKIISSPTYGKALQEAIITQRSGRYVVPVKAEYKNAVPGLVHDISSSGATLFIEPSGVVDANNEIRELEAKEKVEIERILMELSADCADHREDITDDYRVLVSLDGIFARAKLSYTLGCAEPGVREGGEVVLRHARHPLLDRKKAVPIDIRLGGDFDTLVITGPNTGGKTVTLKTLGLLCLMAQCGLHIPVDDGSAVPVFRQVLADIGDEQSIEQSLSTFSAHMTNIVGILDACSPDSLLLFDELGAGTDPVEGAALAISIIEHARGKGAVIAATTHYAELKAYATTSKGVMNASCEFDVDSLRPTYRLLIGVPGKSNAFAIAGRLGLGEDVIRDARRRVDGESVAFEEVLAKLDSQRLELERQRLEADVLLQSAREDRERAETYRRELEKARENATQRARKEAESIIQEARRASDEVMEELKHMRKKQARDQDWQRVNDARAEMRRKLNAAEAALAVPGEEPEPAAAPARPIEAGDTVELVGIGTRAQVISVSGDGSMALQAGIMKITAKPHEVRLVEGAKAQDFQKIVAKSEAALRSAGTKPEIDLRGMMTDEAVSAVERFIDGACMSGLETVTVIHGKGTGALRQAVQTCLKRDRRIKSYRLGRYGEGEDGVTVVTLK